jgi:hypothetical protein
MLTTRAKVARNNGGKSSRSVACPQLQRKTKCACGGTIGRSGECAACAAKRRRGQPLQTKLTVNAPGDRFEQEADRMADFAVSGASRMPPALSAASSIGMQREDKPAPPKPNNYDQALKKILDALKETAVAKELKAKAAEMGKDFIDSVEGKVIAGSALGGALAAIIATNSELPMQIPELPLDFIAPGLKAQITWEGPARNPTSASLKLTGKSGTSVSASYSSTPATGEKPAETKAGLTLTIPLGGSPAKKTGPTESEKFRSETARIAADQAKFREGMKSDKERAEDKAFLDSYMRSKASDPLNPLGPKKKDDLMLMRAASAEASPASAPPVVHDVLSQTGQPLDPPTRAFMESRFGHDFSRVRVHTDAKAAESARAVEASAYTVGEQISFDAGRYSPHSAEGRRLLAHELAHVVQQAGGESSGLQRQDKKPTEPAGQERIDVAIVFGSEDDAMTEARSYAPTALRVTSGEDAKKKLEALGKPIGKVYVVSHSNRSGEVQVVDRAGITTYKKLEDISADMKGMAADKAPTEIDFRGCKLGEAPEQVEKFRKNIGAKSAQALNCWSIVHVATPLVVGGVPLTSPDQVPAGADFGAALKQQINNLKSDDGKAVKNCIAGLKAGETADGNFEKVKKLYWEHKGNLAAVWASPEYNHTWQEGSKCIKDLTDKTSPCKIVTATEPTPAAGAGAQPKGAFLEPQPTDTEYAGDLTQTREGESVA